MLNPPRDKTSRGKSGNVDPVNISLYSSVTFKKSFYSIQRVHLDA